MPIRANPAMNPYTICRASSPWRPRRTNRRFSASCISFVNLRGGVGADVHSGWGVRQGRAGSPQFQRALGVRHLDHGHGSAGFEFLGIRNPHEHLVAGLASIHFIEGGAPRPHAPTEMAGDAKWCGNSWLAVRRTGGGDGGGTGEIPGGGFVEPRRFTWPPPRKATTSSVWFSVNR